MRSRIRLMDCWLLKVVSKMKDVRVSIMSAILRMAALPAAMAAALSSPVPVNSFAISSALIHTPSS
ncbi:hypothetical protein QO002_005383 [Pararhizobium capsulatum DSM 1112]|uniref:Secreted protein n=1 Tax=Pararhizobium capsulatum DSM 1112 TaxID=1121113 RepID=A0ABU0BZ03_9HYPH|nr:hypothetical protein [Pararhizobium capsulatum DSM 1112]